MPFDVDVGLERKRTFESEVHLWNELWQLVSDFGVGDGAEFVTTSQPGEVNTEEIYDSTAKVSRRTAANALLGLLWPDGANSIELDVIHPALKDDDEALDYFQQARDKLVAAMDDPKAGLTVRLKEYMNSQLSYGTSGIFAFEGTKSRFRFQAKDVKTMKIAEDEDGFVDTTYIETERTVRQLVMRFGKEALSGKTQELAKNNKFEEKIKVLHIIEPRMERDEEKKDNKNMAWASIHMEVEAKHVIKESGFQEFPGGVTRYDKEIDEKYGRSPMIDGISDILEINTARESRNVAREKTLDPPLAVYDDGRLGGGIINTSAGALNVVNVAGRAGQNRSPIEPLFTVGDINVVTEEIEELKQAISSHFNIDRLLDLNNDTQMTLGEAQMRRGRTDLSMGTLIARQIMEGFTPLVSRCFNMMMRSGELGLPEGSEEYNARVAAGEEPLIMPESVAKLAGSGQEVYRIVYNTPAARMLQAEEAAGIIQTWNQGQVMANTNPEVLDNLDGDKSIRRLATIWGGKSILRREEIGTDEEPSVKDIREARAQAAQQQQENAQAQQQLENAKLAGEVQQQEE